ncbi:MAG: flavodoxin domain-containing protein [Thermodesulfobacteriota bacterium]|jgi:menaquinone-dependent protoporphyrinogen oxidase
METKANKQRNMDRRDFLVLAGGIIGTISLGSFSPAGSGYAASILFPETRCGDKSNNKVDKKILVAYASEYGSTGGVAEAIGKELCSQGAKADVFLIKNVKNLSSYQGVVVGSAIYRGKWMPEAMDFVKANSEILRQLPVAYFLVCMTLHQPSEENRRIALAYFDPVLQTIPQVKPVDIEPFAGAMHYSNLSWLNKKIIQSKGVTEGDFRDWEAIRSWARGPLFTKLKIL